MNSRSRSGLSSRGRKPTPCPSTTSVPSITRGTINTTLLDPGSTDPNADLVEVRVTDNSGNSATMRLSSAETDAFALALTQFVDKCRADNSGLAPEQIDLTHETTRDDLLRMLLPLRRNDVIDVNVAGESLAITGLTRNDDHGSELDPWYSLELNPGCVADLLRAWRIAPVQRVVNSE